MTLPGERLIPGEVLLAWVPKEPVWPQDTQAEIVRLRRQVEALTQELADLRAGVKP